MIQAAMPARNSFPTVLILNNSFKHNSGIYKPDNTRPQTQIDGTLLGCWQVLGHHNRIAFLKLPIEELVVACNTFGSAVLTTAEAAIRSKLKGLGYGE